MGSCLGMLYVLHGLLDSMGKSRDMFSSLLVSPVIGEEDKLIPPEIGEKFVPGGDWYHND